MNLYHIFTKSGDGLSCCNEMRACRERKRLARAMSGPSNYTRLRRAVGMNESDSGQNYGGVRTSRVSKC